MTDLWDAVGPEIDAEHAALRMTRAKVAVASLWPFLARAESPTEFEHRLDLAGEHIAARVEPELLDEVTASLREDFTAIHRTALEDDANLGQGNPAYFTGGEEHGPATGDTNQFPPHPTGSDPFDPINAQYPAQPQAWTVPPGGEWKEAPMQFGAGSRGRLPFVQSTEGVIPTPGPNPGFFSGGPEGVAGEQSGFPIDLSEAPEDWVNSFGSVPPSTGVTAAAETVENDAPDSDDNAGTEFDSDAERERYREARTGHRFYDPMVSGIQFTAADGDPFGSGNPFASDGGVQGGVPPTPPSLDGGPGSAAQVADGGVPLSTRPRQMPGGGGAPGAPTVPQENAPTPGVTGALSFAAFMREAESQELFSEDNPTGLRDPFQETQFEKARGARPRQDLQDAGINTPQNPRGREPIRTVNSDPSGVREEDEEE